MATSVITKSYRGGNSSYTSNVDANDYLATGFYHLGISQNSPTGSTAYGILCVWQGSGGYVAQLYIGNQGVYARYKGSSSASFNSWMKWGVILKYLKSILRTPEGQVMPV